MRAFLSNSAVGRLVLAGLLVIAIGASAGIVVAATPKKGKSYVGELSGTLSRVGKRVVLKVAPSGDTGRIRLECGGTRFGLSSRFDIVKGKFTALKKTGSLLVWRLKGSFTSSETAKGKLYLPAICDGKGGKITLQLAP